MHTGVQLIVVTVARHFRLTPQELRGGRRYANIVRARWVGLWLARTMLRLSYPQLGQAFGGIDHTTVINACRKVWARLGADTGFRETVLGLRDQIAVNIRDAGDVGYSMHLTVRAAPPRLIVEIPGEQPVELAACIATRRVGEGWDNKPSMAAVGDAWVVVPPEMAALWDRLVAPVWSRLTVEVAENGYHTGKITMSAADKPPPPEVFAQLAVGAGEIRSAHVLVEYDTDDIKAALERTLRPFRRQAQHRRGPGRVHGRGGQGHRRVLDHQDRRLQDQHTGHLRHEHGGRPRGWVMRFSIAGLDPELAARIKAQEADLPPEDE